MKTVLLVSDRSSTRRRLCAALERSGFEALACPGPQAPTYICMGGRGSRCPLAATSDIVVLDCDLASDGAMAGTPSWQLVAYYRARGLPVVALAAPDEATSIMDGSVRVLAPQSDDGTVVAAVRALLREAKNRHRHHGLTPA